MNMFQTASKTKLRFETSGGILSAEELWDMALSDLNSLALSLKGQIDNTPEKSFIKANTVVDKTTVLRFNITKKVIAVRLEENKQKVDAAARRKKDAKILEIIERKEDQADADKSIDELRAMLSDNG